MERSWQDTEWLVFRFFCRLVHRASFLFPQMPFANKVASMSPSYERLSRASLMSADGAFLFQATLNFASHKAR